MKPTALLFFAFLWHFSSAFDATTYPMVFRPTGAAIQVDFKRVNVHAPLVSPCFAFNEVPDMKAKCDEAFNELEKVLGETESKSQLQMQPQTVSANRKPRNVLQQLQNIQKLNFINSLIQALLGTDEPNEATALAILERTLNQTGHKLDYALQLIQYLSKLDNLKDKYKMAMSGFTKGMVC